MARIHPIVYLFLGLTLFCCDAVCLASEDAFPLVARALQAKISRTYQARQDIVWALPPEQGGGMMEIITQTAHAGVKSRTTYLFPPDASGRVMTDDGTQTNIYEPLKRTLLVEPSVAGEMAADLPSMLVLLRRNYLCIHLHREQVNDRECAVVLLRPRTMDGPYKVLWIDEAHPFVLRLEEHDAAGNRCYVSAYDSITFPAHLPIDALAMPQSAKTALRRVMQTVTVQAAGHAAQVFTMAKIAGRLPAWLPAGYALLNTSVVQPDTGQKMVQLRYSDGLKTLTVLQGKATTSLPPPGALNGIMARYGQQAWAQDTGTMRTIVRGDLSLPAGIGQEMLHALAPVTEARLSHGLARDFGTAAVSKPAGLRDAGWDYTQIASLALFLRAHPASAARAKALLARKSDWPAIAHRLHADTGKLDSQARAWIMTTLEQ